MKFINTLSFLSFLFPLITGILLYKKLNKTFRIFFYLVLLGALSDSLIHFLAAQKMHFLATANVYLFFESIVLMFLFFSMKPFLARRKLLPWAIAFFLLLWLFTYSFSAQFTLFNKYVRSIESLVILLFSGIILIYESNHSTLALFKNSNFCLASVFIIYFSLSLAIFSISDLILVDHPTQVAQLWQIPTYLNLVCNLLFSYCIWCNSQTTN